MFNRRLILLIISLGFALGLLIWDWNDTPGVNLKAGSGQVSTARWEMDLSGQWEMYPTLRQAWVTESGRETEKNSTSRLTSGISGYLPSSQGFHVATKTFKVPAEWNARTLILQLNGVKGQLAVYLNGMDSTNRIGNIVSEGGIERLEIPIKALRYGQDNLILLELSAPLSQEQTLFGLRYPIKGQITGQISLQAVMETTLENPQILVNWEGDSAKVKVTFQLLHHGFSEYGPWAVRGILSDGSAEVAQAEVLVNPDENPTQAVGLTFDISNGRKWTPQSPYLYQLNLTVMNPKGNKDDLAFPIALSSIRFDQGVFRQNEEAFPIKGIAILPEREYQARETEDLYELIKGYKDKGYNLLYFVEGFPDELWLDNADKLGMGIWAELPGSAMVPSKRLPQPQIWENLIRNGSLHPSLWAYTAGKGLEINPQSKIANYEKGIRDLTQSIPSLNIRITDKKTTQTESFSTYSQRVIKGSWGEIEWPDSAKDDSREAWTHEKWASSLWAILVVFVAWGNLAALNWRYKELQTRKPKRALRKAWYWQGLALLSREMTLAGVITAFFLSAEPPWSQLIPNQWPLWEGLKGQSPWLLWIILGLLFTLVRLLQVGVAAPNMPDSPPPMGLALWLERRYSWIWIVALLWAAYPWGIPRYLPILTYIGLSTLFLPFKVRDVRRAGGHYGSFYLIPSFLIITLSIISLFRWEDMLYLYHLLKGYYLG
jgi:beta-galactosidase